LAVGPSGNLKRLAASIGIFQRKAKPFKHGFAFAGGEGAVTLDRSFS
jgi:hypothetical protein